MSSTRTLARLVLPVVLALGSVVGPVLEAGDDVGESDFEAGLVEVGTVLESDGPRAATKQLRSLLEAHEDRDYVKASRFHIQELFTRCAHRSRNRPLSPKKVIAGLVSFDRATGKIVLSHKPDRKKVTTPPWQQGTLPPLRFVGPYSVEIRDSYSRGTRFATAPSITVGIEGGSSYLANFGFAPQFTKGSLTGEKSDPAIWRIEGSKRHRLAHKKRSPVRPQGRVTYKVEVEAEKIVMRYRGQVLLTAPKPPDRFGQFYWRKKATYEALTVYGRIDPAWVDRQMALAEEDAYRKFRSTYDSEKDLPDWLAKP